MLYRLILIPVAIALGFVMVVFQPHFCRFDKAFVISTENDIKNLMSQAERYFIDHGSYPKELNQLVPSYLKKIPKDPWKNDYIYSLKRNKPFLKSLGKNGVSGDTGLSYDFSNDTNSEKILNEI